MTALLSDLDGVLVDSSASVERAWRRWAAEQQIPFAALEAVLHGVPSRQTIARFAPHLDAASESRRLDRVQAEDVDGVAALVREADAVIADLRELPSVLDES